MQGGGIGDPEVIGHWEGMVAEEGGPRRRGSCGERSLDENACGRRRGL